MTAARPLATRTLDRCLACGSPLLRALPLRYEFRGRFPAAECRACGMRFLRVQPAGDALAELYSREYFEADFRCGRSASGSFDESAFRAENAGLLDQFARWSPPGRLLEVGCASGWLLRHAEERGWRTTGVELSGPAVEHARGLGLEVFHGDLLEARLPAETYDLVYLGDVLEHVPDCRAVLVEVARVLRRGGHLWLRGPITTNSLARRLALALWGVARRELVLREPPYHLWEFTPRSLRRLFESVGFEVVELEESKIPPGRPHGRKSPLELAAMAALDAVNVPVTRWTGGFGDRVVMVGRKR